MPGVGYVGILFDCCIMVKHGCNMLAVKRFLNIFYVKNVKGKHGGLEAKINPYIYEALFNFSRT